MNYPYSLFLFVWIFVSCSEHSMKPTVKRYRPLDMCSEYKGESDCFDVELIELQQDTPENTLSNIEKIFVLDSCFIISDYDKALCFARDGKYVGKFGDKGNALNEYSSVHDLAVSMDSKRLYILSPSGIVVFDIESREYIRNIKGIDFYMGIAVGKDDTFYFFKTYGSNVSTGETAYPYILRFDKDGNKQSEHLFWKNVVFGRNGIVPTYNNRYFIKPQGEDKICYEICRDSIAPVASFMVDFGDKHTPFRYGVFESDFRAHITSDYFKNIYTPIDNENYVTFCADGPQGVPYQFIINKRRDKGISFSKSRVLFKTSDKDSFYAVLPLDYDQSPFDQQLRRKVGELTEEKSVIAQIKFHF